MGLLVQLWTMSNYHWWVISLVLILTKTYLSRVGILSRRFRHRLTILAMVRREVLLSGSRP
jgi:hypothetical protein